MINVILILLVALIALGGISAVLKRAKGESCCGGGATDVKIGPSDKNKKNYRYSASCTIGGMKCKNCAARIQNALNSLDGTWEKKRGDSSEVGKRGGSCAESCLRPRIFA